MTSLPSMVHNAQTRIGGEVLTYYNLEAGVKVGSIVKTADGYEKNQESSCAEALAAPTSGFACAVIRVSNTAAISVGSEEFPAHSPVGAAIEITGTYTTDIDDYDITATTTGDQVDIILLPAPGNDVLICYDQGVNAEVGAAQRAIPRKMKAVDHYVRQRPENRLTINDIMVSQWDGLRRINLVPITLIVRIYPDGGATPSEIQYYTNVRLSVPPINSPGDANESIEISAEGTYEDVAIFAAQSA